MKTRKFGRPAALFAAGGVLLGLLSVSSGCGPVKQEMAPPAPTNNVPPGGGSTEEYNRMMQQQRGGGGPGAPR